MPLILGMATSHFPSLYQDTYLGWERYWHLLSDGVPQPPEVVNESPTCVADWVQRRNVAFTRMREVFRAHKPDVLVVVGGDQDEWFSPSNLPAIFMYTGNEPIDGFHNMGDFDCDPPVRFWQHPDRFGMRLSVDSDFSKLLSRELVRAGFDISIGNCITPRGRPERKAPHALTRPLPPIMPALDVPIVPLIIRTIERSPGTLSGARCLALGREIARIGALDGKRIAILGSGGMSHDPAGPRSGWVDEPLDRWVLKHVASGESEKLASLFSFRSAANESGTGELRTWLVAAAAMEAAVPGIKGEVLDYFAARKSTVGCGWAIWQTGAEA